jgi:hypothetical protein
MCVRLNVAVIAISHDDERRLQAVAPSVTALFVRNGGLLWHSARIATAWRDDS